MGVSNFRLNSREGNVQVLDMALNSLTETTTNSWFSRIGASIKGMVFGVVAIVVSIVLLWVNERRAVETRKTLEEGAKGYITVSSEKVDPANEGKLVYMVGKATTTDLLVDKELNVNTRGLKLRREVEFFHWEESQKSETKKKLGGSEETVTTYIYDEAWVDAPIDSSRFKNPGRHENPRPALVDFTFTARPITVGAFTLSERLVDSFANFTPLVLGEEMTVPETIGDMEVHPEGGSFYIGRDPGDPEVGDMRVTYAVVQPGEVSVISKQFGSGFEAYSAEAGGKIEMLSEGIQSVESMFGRAQKSNKTLTWILRGVGALMMFFGFSALFRPLSIVADIVPLGGNIVEIGTGFFALFVTISLSLTVIACAWVFYRPLIGIPLILVAVVGIVVLFRKIMQVRKAQMAAV